MEEEKREIRKRMKENKLQMSKKLVNSIKQLDESPKKLDETAEKMKKIKKKLETYNNIEDEEKEKKCINKCRTHRCTRKRFKYKCRRDTNSN